MNCHMNLELKVIREIRIWGLGLGKCKECKFGDRYFKPRKKKKKDNGKPNARTGACVMK